MRVSCLRAHCQSAGGAFRSRCVASVAVVGSLLLSSPAHSEEPNDTFAQSTVLDSGTLSVSDDLYPGTGSAPNTLLGAFDEGGFDPFDNWIADDDDSSTLGNGEASGLADIDVNLDGSVRFVVTGNGDYFFDGDHEQSGGYKAFVEVADSEGSPIDEFSVTGSLQPGEADQYSFLDTAWMGGNYTINLDNTIDGFTGGDVDFFTFVDLNPGAIFSAETTSVGSIDTLLAWYSDAGTLIEQDDDGGFGTWSLLSGVIPASGQLTFAVTGSGDDMFLGEHAQQEVFDLRLTIDGAGLAGDFDGDGDVDATDLGHPTLGWEARFGNGLDGADLLTWQRQLGSATATAASAVAAVPEPASLWLVLAGMASLLSSSNRHNPDLNAIRYIPTTPDLNSADEDPVYQ